MEITVNAYKPISKTGREMPPMPTQKKDIYMRKYLVEQALIEAINSTYLTCLVKAVDVNNFSISDGDMLNEIIWGGNVRLEWIKTK